MGLEEEIEATVSSLNLLDAVIALDQKKREMQAAIDKIKAFMDDNREDIEIAFKECGNAYKGKKLISKDGGKRFTYRHIPQWLCAMEEVKELEEQYKRAWEFGQNGMVLVDSHGEIITPAYVKYVKSSVYLQNVK